MEQRLERQGCGVSSVLLGMRLHSTAIKSRL